MAEKYPNQSLPEQTTAPRDQSEVMEHQHGQVVDHTDPDPVQMEITDQVSALRRSQLIGMQKISQADIRLITHKAELRKAELDNLFGELGISEADIDNGRRNADTTDFQLQSSAILRTWAMNKAKNATRNKVIVALRECYLTDAAEFLEKKFSESLASDMSTDSAVTFELHECQEELRAYYLEDMGKVNMLPWIPEENKEMETIYVDLEFVRKEESKASRTIKSNEDLVTLKTNQGQRVNRVLVTGDAGSGKSTTSSNLAYKWARNDPQSPLSKFTLVFLIRMKDIEDSNSSLVDLIFQITLPEDSNVSKEGLSVYIKENAKDILFVIDGMDEDSSGALKNKSSGITKLLHNRKLRKSCVILTTRPKSISELGMHATHFTRVNLAVFSVTSIHKYIGNFFRDDLGKVDLLFKKLESEPHILALASIPVLLLMICMLWQDKRATPKTKTQLYQKTIGYLWRRYKSKEDRDLTEDEDSDTDEFDEELTDLLNNLGKVALTSIHIDWDKFIFTVTEFGRDVCDLGCQVGLLKKERSREGIKRKTSVAFLHATFKQFCAAFHLAHLLNTKQRQLEDFDGKLFSESANSLTYRHNVLEFCCGIQPEVTVAFLQTASEIYNNFYGDISIHMRHIFEGQLSYEQCSNLIPLISSYRNGFELTDDMIPSVLYMLELYKSSATKTGFLSTINSLTVKAGCTSWLPNLLKHTNNLYTCVVFLGAAGIVGDLDEMYKALSAISNITELVLFNCPGTSVFYRCDATNLLNFLSMNKVKLTGFRLLAFQFDEKVMVRYLSSTSSSILRLELIGLPDARGQFETINNVIAKLSCLKQLNHLKLCRFQIHSVIKHLRPLISQLEELGLIQCCFHEKHLKELFTFLIRAKKLKSIDLSANLLTVASVQALVNSLNKIEFLEKLSLEHTGLNDESASILANFVRDKSSMNFLSLAGNPGIGKAVEDTLRGLPLKRYVSASLFSQVFEDIETI